MITFQRLPTLPCIQECLNEVANRDGRKPIIYTAKYYWKDHVTASSDWAKYDLWLASYDSKPYLPTSWSNWKFWQYSESGKVSGISGSCDLNWFQGTYDDLLKYCGKSSSDTTPQTTTTGVSARIVVPVLNIRSGPSTSTSKIGKLQNGNTINILSLTGKDVWLESDSGKWSACFLGGQQYMEILPVSNAVDGLKARVLVDHLNKRSGPSTAYADIGNFNTGDTFKIKSINGKDSWVQFDQGKWSAFSIDNSQFMELVN